MAFRPPDTQQRKFYNQAASNAPSTASLLPPSARGPQAVQAAFARAPPSIRTAQSFPSIVRTIQTTPLISPPPPRRMRPRTRAQPLAGHLPKYLLSQTRQVPSHSFSPANPPFLQFSLSPDPQLWGADLSPNHPEPDDFLHNPDPRRDRRNDRGGSVFTCRGLTNLGCLIFLALGLVALLYVLSFLTIPH